MERLVDAHAHLADPVFDADRDAVLARARDAGVERILVVGETLADARRTLELADRHPELLPCAGLYPTHLDRDDLDAMLAFVREHADRLAAVGEIGLDHWVVKDAGDLAVQRTFFREQVALAQELDLPVNVHSRSAGRATIEALLEAGARSVLLHAFDGRAGTAEAAVRAGYYLSVPPSIVRSRQKQKLVRALPLECLLLETDSPVLGAEPGVRNEPAAVRTALAAVAAIKKLPEGQVAAITTANARRLFGPRLDFER